MFAFQNIIIERIALSITPGGNVQVFWGDLCCWASFSLAQHSTEKQANSHKMKSLCAKPTVTASSKTSVPVARSPPAVLRASTVARAHKEQPNLRAVSLGLLTSLCAGM